VLFVNGTKNPLLFFIFSSPAKSNTFFPEIETLKSVIPEDVRYIGKDVLRHRMLLSYEAEAEEVTSEELIDQLFKEIPVP
jgi:hypothetical protein